MGQPDYEQASRYALDRLEHELDSSFCYHSIVHTRDDVFPAVERLAALSDLGADDRLLVRTAALFHDIGYVEQLHDHEEAGVRICASILPGFGYSPAAIDRIAGMIRATRLPQSPQSLIEQILADADLDVLGRDDFLIRNRLLRSEMAAFGKHFSDIEWYREQLHFLQSHSYWTPAAHHLRDPGKSHNYTALCRLLADTGSREDG